MNSTTLPLERGAGAPIGPALVEAKAKFARLRRAAHKGIWIETLGVLGLLLVAFALPSFVTDRFLRLEWIFRCVLLASFLLVVLRVVHRRWWRPLQVVLTDEEMALAVERQSPDVRQALISSLQFDAELVAAESGSGASSVESAELKAAVVADVNARLASIPFARAIDAGRVRKYACGVLAAIAAFGSWAAVDGASLLLWARRNLALGNVDWPRYTTVAFADVPATGVRMPQGDALTVRLVVEGPVPDQVFVDYEFEGDEKGTEPMSRTGDREFTWNLDTVLANVTLRAQGGDALPAELLVTVVERPRIDDLSIEVTFPTYMERDPELVPPTEGELRLPRGAKLAVAGKSHKPIDTAFLLFGNDQKIVLARAADKLAFRGEFMPPASGLLVVDVVDQDQLGAGSPPRLLLRVGDDKAPTLDFRLRGVGPSITSHARIPGDLKVKDDFGLREVDASMRAVLDTASEAKPGVAEPTPAPEVPFEPALAKWDTPLPRSALRYDTQASVDLRQWNRIDDENAQQNRIRPGMLFSLRFGAKDNFGPGDPHVGYGETMTFRIVTREKLGEELRRRQLEQRQELQRIADEVQAASLEVGEVVNPQQAGERRQLVETRLKALARQQQATGRRVAFVGESYQRILWEYENNRLWEANKVRQVEGLITAPLAALAKDAFPATSRLVEAFSRTAQEETRASAVNGYRDIRRRIAAILKEMEQAENLAALLEELRTVIKIEDSAIQDVEKRLRERERDVFGPGKDKNK